MDDQISESDRLRLPHQVYVADPRQALFVRVDRETGLHWKRTVEDQYQAISRFTLNDCVPGNVAAHFETARNIYLYAWFVYRFYSAAEQQVLASLEFALRERFPDFVAAEKGRRPKGIEPGLKKLFRHAIDKGFVKNENLLARERWARQRARKRYQYQKIEEIRKAGIDEWIEDESEIVVTEEDLRYDYLGAFLETIPTIRNLYAHGSDYLYPAMVCQSFEIVMEIINQLYPLKGDERGSNS